METRKVIMDVIEQKISDEKTKEIFLEAKHYATDVLSVVKKIDQLSDGEKVIFIYAIAKYIDGSLNKAFETKEELNQFKQKMSFYFEE